MKSMKFTCTRIFIIRLGLRVSATCDSAERANRLAVRLAAEVSENDTTDIVGKATQNNAPHVYKFSYEMLTLWSFI